MFAIGSRCRWICLWVMLGSIWRPTGLVSETCGETSGHEPDRVLIKTSMGEMVVQLDRIKAPVTCDNFLSYVHKNYYDGTIFHRVIADFMVQGGGFTADLQKKQPGPPIANEWQNGLKNTRGSIAMARLGRRPDSATCQFFINVRDNPSLDQPRDGAGYAVFGHVVQGMDVLDRIRVVPTGLRRGYQDVPIEPVMIEQIRLIEQDESATSQPSKDRTNR